MNKETILDYNCNERCLECGSDNTFYEDNVINKNNDTDFFIDYTHCVTCLDCKASEFIGITKRKKS